MRGEQTEHNSGFAKLLQANRKYITWMHIFLVVILHRHPAGKVPNLMDCNVQLPLSMQGQ